MLPALALYDYFARTVSRDLGHCVFARLIKVEALAKLSFFGEAMDLLVSLQRGENLPHFIDDKSKNLVYFKNVHFEFFFAFFFSTIQLLIVFIIFKE